MGLGNQEIFETLNTILTGGDDGNVMNTVDAIATIATARLHRYHDPCNSLFRFIRLNMAFYICHELSLPLFKPTTGKSVSKGSKSTEVNLSFH